MKLLVLFLVLAMAVTIFAVKPPQRRQPSRGGYFDNQRGAGSRKQGYGEPCYDGSHGHAPGEVHPHDWRGGSSSGGRGYDEGTYGGPHQREDYGQPFGESRYDRPSYDGEGSSHGRGNQKRGNKG